MTIRKQRWPAGRRCFYLRRGMVLRVNPGMIAGRLRFQMQLPWPKASAWVAFSLSDGNMTGQSER